MLFRLFQFLNDPKNDKGAFHLSRRGGKVGGSYPSPPAYGVSDSFEIHPNDKAEPRLNEPILLPSQEKLKE
jgi:hypothetical protein